MYRGSSRAKERDGGEGIRHKQREEDGERGREEGERERGERGGGERACVCVHCTEVGTGLASSALGP